MPGRLGQLLDERAREAFTGRDEELAVLGSLLDAGGPRVVHVSGVSGIGKTALLEAFAERAREAGASVVRIDCRAVEPSVPGLLEALALATGVTEPALEPIADRLAVLPGPVVVAFDGYELFWLVDTFIRRELCPRLPAATGLILAGKNGPVGAWLSAPEWHGLFRPITLGPLTERESLAWLSAMGLGPEAARRINSVARGHPLALGVAARLAPGPGTIRPEDAAMGAVVELVAHDYLAAAVDPATREALEAASTVRRVTEPLLSAMLPGVAPRDVMDRLARLPFVDTAVDGLFIHDAVRDAISSSLMASDPERHRRYRVAAWHQLRKAVTHATRATLWRYTADILYLLQNYLVREGFFPSGYQPLAVEPAQAADGPAIQSITADHDGTEAAGVVDAWWSLHPGAFRVCRDAGGATTGMFIVARGNEVSEDIIAADPVAAAWAADMHAGGHAPQSLLLRRLLDHLEGEGNSGSRGAFGVEVKRTYMEMRPDLRYIYLCGVDPANFDWCDPLGFVQLTGLARDLDGRRYRTFRLDMGPGSVDAWLGRVVADELGIPAQERDDAPFDAEAQELVVDGVRIPLTRLEVAVMRVLHERSGKPVSRADLVERAWGYETGATSNVVEAVILTLRRKLGPRANAIETVRGIGYRYRP